MNVDAAPANSHESTARAGLLALLTLPATAIAAYLSWLHWGQQGLPVGCGDHSGCAEVLTSRWSAVMGIPIGLFGIPVYGLVAALAIRPPTQRMMRQGLMFAAGVLVSAAAWFIFLQAVVIGAFCPWCMAEHVLGLAMAALAVRHVRRSVHGSSAAPAPRTSLMTGGLLGVLSVVVLSGLQRMTPAPVTTVRMADDTTRDTTSEADRADRVVLLDGQLRIDLGQEPVLGDPAAPRQLYLMFDYCCPHCRRTHGYLLDALEKHAGELNLVCLPMPRDADCNPAITETESRFEHACELARLALSVWIAKPESFADFDRWLFEPSRPPSLDAARAEAERLVSAEALAQALRAPEIETRIARNVKAFNDSQAGYLPVMMAQGMETIVGRPESRDAVLNLLEDELLRPSQ